jgi:uncharacterized protein with NAD-binding domain and iron-sulfur cluster
MSESKKRIAILGGGMSALTTAWELTNQPGWQDRYEITVYQQGWRVGGKGASGRNPERYQRIEEHGLHILFGFYENAFRVMRKCYAELGRHPSQPLATWQDAFKPQSLIVMMEKVGDQYLPWAVDCPTNSLTPGDGQDTPEPWQYVQVCLDFLVERFRQWSEGMAQAVVHGATDRLGLGGELQSLRAHVRQIVEHDPSAEESTSFLGEIERTLWSALKAAATGMVARELAGESLYLELARELSAAMPRDPRTHERADQTAVLWLLRRFDEWLWALPYHDTEARRLKMVVDFTVTVVIGLIEDGLITPPQDWFKIDDRDFRAWLREKGARPETVDGPIVQGLYDAIFSTLAPMGAGTIVHLLLRMGFTYRGAVLYKMQAGMGDTVFTPLYTVLERRGVQFKFFHCVNQIHLSADKKRIQTIDIGRQATVKDGAYRPLVDVGGLPSWPSHPLYEQLVEGATLRERGIDLESFWADWPDVESIALEADRDFDLCVLGISVAAFPFLCRELMDDPDNPRFRKMVEAVATCQTQALQLWLTPGLPQLGWPLASPVVIPYVEPYDTWADMSQLIAREAWPPTLPVGNIAYFCSVMDDDGPLPPPSDHGYPARQNQRARDNALAWLRTNVRALWPAATQPGTPDALNWFWLVDPEQRRGEARLEAQYWHAPVSPSERYVLSVPGSSRARLRADESGYANLLLTGDYLLTSLSAGCLEAATMAGLQTAAAITGAGPPIIGDWLPQPEPEPRGK